MSSRRTRSRTSDGDVTTPNRRSSGSRMSWARPTTSPPPQGAVMNAPAHCIRGPSTSPRVDRVAQRDVGEGPERAEVADRGEARLDGLAGMPHAEQHVLRRAGGGRRHVGGLDVADEVAVGVDEAGQDGQAAEVEHRRPVGRAVVRTQDRLDPPVADEERPARERLAGLDVEQGAGPDGERAAGVGEGGRSSPDRSRGGRAAPARPARLRATCPADLPRTMTNARNVTVSRRHAVVPAITRIASRSLVSPWRLTTSTPIPRSGAGTGGNGG